MSLSAPCVTVLSPPDHPGGRSPWPLADPQSPSCGCGTFPSIPGSLCFRGLPRDGARSAAVMTVDQGLPGLPSDHCGHWLDTTGGSSSLHRYMGDNSLDSSDVLFLVAVAGAQDFGRLTGSMTMAESCPGT